MIDNMLSTAQAAEIAKRNSRTIVAWIHAGKLPAFKLPGGRGPYLIDRADLEQTLLDLYTPHPYKPGKDDRKENT